MKNYKVWDRKEYINGVNANHFLEQEPFRNYNGDIILIYAGNGKVSNVECKDILASLYEIDSTLDIDSFMIAYFKKLEEMIEKEEAVNEEQ